jgi:hypothetical protein
MSIFPWFTCKAFIDEEEPKKQKRLLELLPAEVRERVTALRFENPGWQRIAFQEEDLLHIIHPSWMLEGIRGRSVGEMASLVGLLSLKQQETLSDALPDMGDGIRLTSLGRIYCRRHLLKSIPDIYECVPREALHLSFNLGLREFSQYVKLVIDKQKRKEIAAAFSQEEWQRLEQSIMKRDPLKVERSIFDAWSGNKDSLRLLIERRGLNRLAKALFGEDPALFWYVTHILDTEKAQFLYKLRTVGGSKAIHDLLKQQILEILQEG